MSELVLEYGPAGLMLVSFLAATLLPFSSEVALLTAVAAGIPASQALIWASAGNVTACVVNYGLGYYFRVKTYRKIRRSRWGYKAIQLWQNMPLWDTFFS